MPDKLDKSLLILGLAIYILGQIWIVTNGAMTKDEIAVDVSHWLMFVGVAFIIPFAVKLPRRGLSLLAGPVLFVGCILVICMCVVDFVLWSFPEPETRTLVVEELMRTPMVWTPFIVAAGPIFVAGLILAGLSYWRTSRIGAGLVIVGAAIIQAWGLGSNPYGYAVMIAGFLMCFRTHPNKGLTSAA